MVLIVDESQLRGFIYKEMLTRALGLFEVWHD